MIHGGDQKDQIHFEELTKLCDIEEMTVTMV